jgi:hypothetical protein
MNYEKPELTLTDAIRAIQTIGAKPEPSDEETAFTYVLPISCYEDNE